MRTFLGLALASDLDAANSQIAALLAHVEHLTARNSMVQALAERGGANLEDVFSSKLNEVPTNSDDRKVFELASGLGLVVVFTGRGLIRLTDPNGLIQGKVEVTLDTLGQLDEKEQRQINDFLGRVYVAKNSPITPVKGKVSVIARPSCDDSTQELVPVGKA